MEEKMKKWYFRILNLTKTEAFDSIKFINQWYFIGLNFETDDLAWKSVVTPSILKMAEGKFIRNSQCEEVFGTYVCYLITKFSALKHKAFVQIYPLMFKK